MKNGNSDGTRFQYKVIVIFNLELKYLSASLQSSQHLQCALLKKLLGQFIELHHNARFFKD